MTTSQTKGWVKVALLAIALLALLILTPPVQNKWSEWRLATNTKNKSAKEEKVAAQKKSAAAAVKQQPADNPPLNVAIYEMTDEQKKFMFDGTSSNVTPTPWEGGSQVVMQTGKEITIAAKPKSLPTASGLGVGEIVVLAPKAPVVAVKPPTGTVAQVKVQKPAQPARRISSQPVQKLSASNSRQNQPVVAVSPKPDLVLLPQEALVQKQVPKVVLPTQSRDSRWNTVCEDKNGFGVPPTVQCP